MMDIGRKISEVDFREGESGDAEKGRLPGPGERSAC